MFERVGRLPAAHATKDLKSFTQQLLGHGQANARGNTSNQDALLHSLVLWMEGLNRRHGWSTYQSETSSAGTLLFRPMSAHDVTNVNQRGDPTASAPGGNLPVHPSPNVASAGSIRWSPDNAIQLP